MEHLDTDPPEGELPGQWASSDVLTQLPEFPPGHLTPQGPLQGPRASLVTILWPLDDEPGPGACISPSIDYAESSVIPGIFSLWWI